MVFGDSRGYFEVETGVIRDGSEGCSEVIHAKNGQFYTGNKNGSAGRADGRRERQEERILGTVFQKTTK